MADTAPQTGYAPVNGLNIYYEILSSSSSPRRHVPYLRNRSPSQLREVAKIVCWVLQ